MFPGLEEDLRKEYEIMMVKKKMKVVPDESGALADYMMTREQYKNLFNADYLKDTGLIRSKMLWIENKNQII